MSINGRETLVGKQKQLDIDNVLRLRTQGSMSGGNWP